MAPELLKKKSYDYTVDIWGLGILLFELMHGHSPYRAKKIDQIYDNIINQRMKFSSRVSEEVKDLLIKILQINPADRLSLEGILEHPWMVKYSKLKKLNELSYKTNYKEKALKKIENKDTNKENTLVSTEFGPFDTSQKRNKFR
jgi:serine/threonine protein kinase